MITLELECWGTHICEVQKSATPRVMTAVWVAHRSYALGTPVCCWGVVRQGERKQADWNGHRPTYPHMMYHAGQYLFFTPISTGPAASGMERRYHDKQPENWDVVS